MSVLARICVVVKLCPKISMLCCDDVFTVNLRCGSAVSVSDADWRSSVCLLELAGAWDSELCSFTTLLEEKLAQIAAEVSAQA